MMRGSRRRNPSGTPTAAVALACALVAATASAQQTEAVFPAALHEASIAEAEALVGKRVLGRDGERLGTVADVILNAAGRPEQLVLRSAVPADDGAREVAIDVAGSVPEKDAVRAPGLTLADIAALPAFDWDEGATSLGRGGPAADTAVPGDAAAIR